MPTLIDANGAFVKTLKNGNKAVIAAGEQANVDSAMKNHLDEQVAKNLCQQTIDFEVKKKTIKKKRDCRVVVKVKESNLLIFLTM